MNKRELTALQTQLVEALKPFNTMRARHIIRENESVLTYRNNNDETALDILADAQEAAAVAWLCQEMQDSHLSIDTETKDNLSVVQRAYLRGNHKILNILMKYTRDPNLKAWFVKKQLVSIIGAQKLRENNIYISSNLDDAADAGTGTEATQILASAIGQFAKTRQNYTDIANYIRNFQDNSLQQHYKNYDCGELIRQANEKKNQRILFQSGYHKHSFSCGLKKNDDGTYQLSIYDDSEMNFTFADLLRFYLFADVAFVRRINIAAADLPEVMKKLTSYSETSASEMKTWLNHLPSKLHSRYHYDNRMTYNLYTRETNRCFWNNPQYAVLDNFIDHFGEEPGKREFAGFMTFVREQALTHFKKAFADNLDLVSSEKIEGIIAKDKPRENVFWTAPRKNMAKNTLAATSILLGLGLITFGILMSLPPLIALAAPLISFTFLLPVHLFNALKITAETVTRFIRICFRIGTPTPLTRDEEISIRSSYRHINQIMPSVRKAGVVPTPGPTHQSSGPFFPPAPIKATRYNSRSDDNLELWPVSPTGLRA